MEHCLAEKKNIKGVNGYLWNVQVGQIWSGVNEYKYKRIRTKIHETARCL